MHSLNFYLSINIWQSDLENSEFDHPARDAFCKEHMNSMTRLSNVKEAIVLESFFFFGSLVDGGKWI